MSATNSCQFEPTADPNVAYCPTGLQVLISADNLILLSNAPDVRDAPLVLPRGVETQIATFAAKGTVRSPGSTAASDEPPVDASLAATQPGATHTLTAWHREVNPVRLRNAGFGTL